MLRFLDHFFILFHTLLICFNLLGWVWRKTRLANLITLCLTGGSWFILGIFYGLGYCPLTQWHWEVLEKLGVHDLPDSYITYLAYRITGWQANPSLAEALTVAFFFLALSASVYVNFFRRNPRRKHG